MKKFYLLSLLFLLLLSNAAFSQMQRVIRNNNGSIAQTIINSPVNNFANAVTSCSLDTILLTTQAQINNFATNYPTCANPKYLIINGLGASPAITSLAGLSSVTQVINKLKITNTSVTNLSQLTSLTQIGDTLELEKNNLLANIGLNNLTQLGSIYFKNLPALTSIAGLSNIITTMNNVRLDSTLALANISGLSGIITLNGNLEIGYTALTSLSALNNCTYINGWMWINNNPNVTTMGLTNLTHCGFFLLSDMPLLTSLAGLTTNITNTNTGTFWVINTGVTNLNGLQSLTSTTNFYINGNPNLTNITALQNLNGDISSGFSIYGNPLLTSIAALSGITGVQYDGSVEISYNAITTLNGLQNIVNINKGLIIAGNNNLTSLSALNNNLIIQNNPDSYNGTKDSVRIYDNQQLALCNDTSICNYLNGGGAAFIDNNAAGCNTIADIQASCTAGPNYNDFEPNCCTFNAIPIAQGQVKYGNVGHYIGVDGNGDPLFDDYDTYRIIMPYDGAFKLFVTAKNDSSCFENTSTSFNVDVLDENSNTVQNKNLFNWSLGQACNTNKTDSFKFRGYRGDTVYLRFNGDKISYNFTWQALDSTMTGSEFNNNVSTAYLINPLQTKKGNVGFKNRSYHNFDLYKTVLPVTANIEVYLKITNRENQTIAPANRFHFQWGYTAPYGYFSNSNYPLLPAIDAVIYDTLRICSLANDTMYFRLIADAEAYEYEWSYKIKDTLPNDQAEPNNSFSQAASLPINQLQQSNIGFIGKSSSDQLDFFKVITPNRGTLQIIMQAVNTNCVGSGFLLTQLYSKQQNNIGGQYVGNNLNIPAGLVIYDTINFCDLAADTFYIKFSQNIPFRYQFRYQVVDTPFVDIEPNNSFAQATAVAELEEKSGNVNQQNDLYDYYRFILPKDGTLKITTQAYLGGCAGGLIRMAGFDRRQANGYVFEKYFPVNSNGTSGQIIFDTAYICGRAADTFYLRFQGSNLPGNYKFKYQMVDTSTNDVEPNNNFATALPIAENQTKAGHIKYFSNGGADDLDYYKTLLPKDGTLKIMVQATNMSCANNQWVYLRGYDRRQGNGQIFEKYLANNSAVAAGQTVYDTIFICGRAADSFYLRFEASNSFKYQWSYVMVDTSINDVEPNNDFATALPIAELQTIVGHIKYISNGGADDFDYYKTLLPKDGTIKIMVQATNMSCANNQWVYLRGYDRRQGSGQIFEKYLAGNSAVAAGQTVYDTILVCGRAADSFYLRFEASNSFKYQWSYVMVDTSANDIEPNNSFATAIGVGSNQTKRGHIKYYSNGGSDDFDYYKFIFANTDSLKLQMQATNMSCGNNQWIYIRAYDKNFNQLFERYFAGNSAVAAGQTVFDSIKIFVNAPDTIYLRYEASSSFKYQFTSNPRQPTGLFTIAGDSTVCFGTKTYKAINVVDDNVVYNWALTGGGSLTFVDSIATVNWTTNGTQNLSLYLSNIYGNSLYKQKTIIVNNNPPTEVPVLLNFARTLSTNNLPSGTVCNWYKSGVLIAGITDSIYYAQDSGTYTARFVRPCGTGPASNSFYFPLPAQVQNIIFTHTPNIIFSPTAKAKLNATASSGLSVSFQLISGNATIVNDTVYVISGGLVIVKAIQQGSNIFAAAAPKYDTISVLPGPQTITFNPIPSQIFSANALALTATSSSGLPIVYNIASGNAYIYGSSLVFTGAGLITVQATQPGNTNYAAAIPVQQTFCTGVRNLTAIYGSVSPCLNNYIYTTDKIPAANYVWTLSSGGTMVASNDTAYINWTTPGTHTITVKANTACDAVYSNIVSFTITTANNPPTPVSNMLPVNNAVNQQLPLALSWQPGLYTVNYDLYVWDSAQAQPALPYAANIATVNFTLPQNSFVYSKAYKWRIVSKNPCGLTIAGPVQQFRLVPLPDLAVTQVLAPQTAFSGQTVSINWTVKNNGPGRTQTNQTWADAVYLSFDSIPKFNLTPETNPAAWNQLQFPIRPLLIASKPNVSALDSGQVYSNTANFTLPLNYNLPLYVYVITNNPANPNLPQVTYVNDTARAVQPIVVTLSPTPDLRVDTVFTPASTFSGSTVNVTYKVKNYGVVTPPNVSWYDKFYLSPTAIFNPANSVELFPQKAYNRYYDCSGNYNPGIIHTTQLNADSSYTNAVQLVIPNFIVGTYFIHVKTNNTASLYEGAFINNNTNSNQIQVYLTPTPLLDVANLSIQNTNVSTTQNISVNWNINNGGFFDNLQKGQGHYAKQGAFCANIITGYTNPGNQPITVAGFSYTDSIAVGSSYWNDKIYLSRDSGAIETANLILLNKYDHGLQNNAPPCDNYNGTCLAGGNNDRNVFNIIKPVTNYPSVATINIPDTLSAGNYYVYVLANADKTVYEYPNNNKYKRSGIIIVNRPDLIPPTVSVQPNSNAGVPIQINYTISNAGMGNVYNHLRRDKYFVSTSPVFTGGAVQIGIQIFTENVLTGSPVTHSFSYTFPPGTPSSNRYFYVVTNYDSSFRETTMANNTSAAAVTFVTIAVAKDLIVSNVQLPANLTDTVFTITNVPIKYTVSNNGADSIANKTWVDSIFVSCTPSFNSNTAYYLTRRIHNNILAAGENYSDSFNINIPKFSYELNNCFGIDNTNAYFFVRTNADTGVYEGANMVNNYTASIQKKLINPYIDLIVPNVGGSDTATVARNYTANWSVKNIKYYTAYGYYQYRDGIYFSPDSLFNINAIFVTDRGEDRQLLTNQTISSTQTFILPNIPTGDYYVHVKTNYNNAIQGEKNIGNNTNLIRNGVGAAKKIHVNATPLPDITDSIITAPTLLAVGQSYNVKYKIKNEGVGASYPNYMNTGVYLSTNTQPGGLFLQQTPYNNSLQPGSFYTDSITINIPINTIPGNYVLVVNADNSNNIVESNKNNNTSYKYVTVYSPAPSDLIVQNVSHPDSVYLGYTIDSLKWIVQNISPNAAQGISSDGLYLSASNTFDSTSTLIGIKNKTINMLPLASDTLQAQPRVNNVTEGNYKVFVKTDFLNNIMESNKDNNVGSPVGNIYVKVKQLPLNVLTPNTLSNIARYYKLIIPDSLNGSTILVTLKSNDSLTSTNQMYIGKGFIPSAAHFDYQYDKPNYGNQDIVITSVTAGSYYITTTKITATNPTQTISLKAVKLPFAILNVQSSSGGNTGNVTVKISGSLFGNNMVAKLTKPGTTITASAVYFINSTSVYATFNLAGKPLGIYDVSLTKPDTTVALLAGSFSIVPANNGGLITGGGTNGIPGNGNDAGCDPNAPSGLNSQLITEIVLPPKVFGGWPFVIQINYNNPTNVDIAAQTRILYCIDGFPISFTAAGLANATSSIYLELTEPGGPPGIIRAGGSGTITLYSKPFVTFPAHEYGNYILK